MPFVVEVRGRDGLWKPLRPFSMVPKVDAAPYSWPTREEADRAMRTFYPDQARVEDGGVRVSEAP